MSTYEQDGAHEAVHEDGEKHESFKARTYSKQTEKLTSQQRMHSPTTAKEHATPA